MDFTKIPVQRRETSGTNSSNRLRRDGKVPVVLYGLGKPTLSLSADGRELDRVMRSGNRLVDLALGSESRTALLRSAQFDPTSDELLHVDFLRVDREAEIEDTVPVVFRGRAKGAAEGGVFQPLRNAIEIRCKPASLPREIVIEVDHLGLHDSIHAADVKLPAGVSLRGNKDLVMCVVTTIKVVAAATPAEGAPAEPELIGKKKEEEGAEGAAAEGAAKPGDKAAKPEAKKDEKKK
ncbi:MAG: 50S ribosomal protein L25 [Planctomycetia bacterium]